MFSFFLISNYFTPRTKRSKELSVVYSTTTNYFLTDVAEKLGDAKNGTIASEVLIALAEATRLDYVASEVIDYAFNKQKSPKVQQESLNWLSQALLEFGFV